MASQRPSEAWRRPRREPCGRTSPNKAWRRVKNLQKLLVRATSNKLLAIRRITQENRGHVVLNMTLVM
jgi:hypothetical protein